MEDKNDKSKQKLAGNVAGIGLLCLVIGGLGLVYSLTTTGLIMSGTVGHRYDSLSLQVWGLTIICILLGFPMYYWGMKNKASTNSGYVSDDAPYLERVAVIIGDYFGSLCVACGVGCGFYFMLFFVILGDGLSSRSEADYTFFYSGFGLCILAVIIGFGLIFMGKGLNDPKKESPGISLDHCPQCLVKISEDTKYCPACGADVKSLRSTGKDSFGNSVAGKKGLWTGLAVIGIICIIAIVGSMYCFPGVLPYSIFPPDTTWSYTNPTLPETPGYATINLFSDSSPVTCEYVREDRTDKIFIPSDTWEVVYTADPIIATNCMRTPYMLISVKSDDAAASHSPDWIRTPAFEPDQWKTDGQDSRPWVKQFNSGRGHYIFTIESSSINSYTIEIRVPTNS
jgi:hypothetical protein